MRYREYRPDTALSPFVECYWSAYSERPPFRERERLIPDGTIELMFNFGDDYSQIVGDTERPVKGSHVIGIRRQALVISQTRRQNFFCIRFKAGGSYPFFRIPANEFANGFHGVDDLFDRSVRELEERLYEADSDEDRTVLANRFLLGRLREVQTEHRLVARLARDLLTGRHRIADLARSYGISHKSIDRYFDRVVGLPPSSLTKIVRFNGAVLAMYRRPEATLSRVALDAGYYDQAHFIRDFKDLTGLAPREFMRERYTIVEVIQPALSARVSNSYNP